MARPYWSGQIQISLVSFGVSLFTATEAASQIRFHQIDRKTGERVRHKKVTEDQEGVENADIVKGYEFRKGEYVTLEPEEIANVRMPSKKTLQIVQFVDIGEIGREYFEKPYFVLPENDSQAQAFAVIQKALRDTGKAGLGEAAFAGREHLIALMPPAETKSRGLMAYTMRYAEELRDASEYFSNMKEVEIDKDQLALAKELVGRYTKAFDPSKFQDDYEAALRELVEAKIEEKPLPLEEEAPKRAKVINLMDAQRKSVGEETPARERQTRTGGRAGQKKPAARAMEKTGPQLVKSPKRKKRTA
jgi:DNA end-binding protein Ku